MTWLLQPTVWALPSLLAVLLVLRDLEYLWVHRREPAARALAALAGTSGLWASVHLLTVVTPTVPFVSRLVSAGDVLSVLAPLAWLWFALSYSGRERELRSWPMGLLYAFAAATVLLTFFPTTRTVLFGAASLVEHGGRAMVNVERGSVFWLADLLRVGMVTGATVVLLKHLARSEGPRMRAPVALAAALVGVAPVLMHLWWSPTSVSRDLAPAGFGVASALLGWGVLRFRLLKLGPVARTLVMVEIHDPIVVLDGKGRIVDVNRTARHTLGLHPYGDVPLTLGTLWARSRQEPINSSRICLEVATKEGLEERAFEVMITSLDKRGAPGRSALVLRDVTDRERMEQELERLAKTDDLTGLANRRHFQEALDKELDRAARYERPLALVLTDLDHFKEVNDSFGHAAGDEVLQAAAQVLLDVSRDVDLAARIGGDEFVLLLPETDVMGARAVADRIRTKMKSLHHHSPSGVPFQVTASLGVTSVRAGAIEPETLLQRADEAMYRAKQGGRNRVETTQ